MVFIPVKQCPHQVIFASRIPQTPFQCLPTFDNHLSEPTSNRAIKNRKFGLDIQGYL